MALSELQIKHAEAVFKVAECDLETMKKGIRDGKDRINQLTKAGFHIERFMVNAQLLEHTVKAVLYMCRLKRDVMKHINLADPYANAGRDAKDQRNFEHNFDRFERLPLGIIIKLLRQTTQENDIAGKLNDFNTYRQIFIHQTFNGSHDLEEMNNKAKDYLTENKDLDDMVRLLVDLHSRINVEIEAIYTSALGGS